MTTSCVDIVCSRCKRQYAYTYDKKKSSASLTLFDAGWRWEGYKPGNSKWFCPECNKQNRKKRSG